MGANCFGCSDSYSKKMPDPDKKEFYNDPYFLKVKTNNSTRCEHLVQMENDIK